MASLLETVLRYPVETSGCYDTYIIEYDHFLQEQGTHSTRTGIKRYRFFKIKFTMAFSMFLPENTNEIKQGYNKFLIG